MPQGNLPNVLKSIDAKSSSEHEHPLNVVKRCLNDKYTENISLNTRFQELVPTPNLVQQKLKAPRKSFNYKAQVVTKTLLDDRVSKETSEKHHIFLHFYFDKFINITMCL